MAKFPITRAPEKISIENPNARANINVSTGAEAIGVAMGRLGQSAFQLGLHLDVLEAKEQADTAERDARLSFDQMINEINNPPEGAEDNMDRWKAAYDAHTKRIDKYTPKNLRGARLYKSRIANWTPGWQKGFNSLVEFKLDDKMVATSMRKVDDLLNTATLENMDSVVSAIKAELIVRGKLSPSISEVQTQRAISNIERDIRLTIKNEELIQKRNELEKTVNAIAKEKGYDAALDYLNKPETRERLQKKGLDSGTIDSLFGDLKTQVAYNKAEETSTLERVIWKNASQMRLTESYKSAMTYIQNANIPEKIRNNIESRLKALQSLESGEEGNLEGNKIYWLLWRKANENPNDPNLQTEIDRAVLSNLITPVQGKDILKAKDKSDLRSAIYLGKLDSLAQNGALEIHEWETINEQFTQWLEDNPKAAPKQVQEKFEELVKDKRKSFILKLFSGEFGMSKLVTAPLYATPLAGLAVTRNKLKEVLSGGTDETKEPKSEEEFKATLRNLADDDVKLMEYYNKYKDKFVNG